MGDSLSARRKCAKFTAQLRAVKLCSKSRYLRLVGPLKRLCELSYVRALLVGARGAPTVSLRELATPIETHRYNRRRRSASRWRKSCETEQTYTRVGCCCDDSLGRQRSDEVASKVIAAVKSITKGVWCYRANASVSPDNEPTWCQISPIQDDRNIALIIRGEMLSIPLAGDYLRKG